MIWLAHAYARYRFLAVKQALEFVVAHDLISDALTCVRFSAFCMLFDLMYSHSFLTI